MSAYDQMKEMFFAGLESTGTAEDLVLIRKGQQPVPFRGYCSPPGESSSENQMASFDVSTGRVVVPPEVGNLAEEGDRVSRSTEEDDREYVISRIMARSAAAVVCAVVNKDMDDLYGSGMRAMRGNG